MTTITCLNCGYLHFLLHGILVARMKCEKCRNEFPTVGRVRGVKEDTLTTPSDEFLGKLSFQEKAWVVRLMIPILFAGWFAGPAYVGFHWAHGRHGNALQIVFGTFLASLIGAVAGGLAGGLIGFAFVVVRKVIRFIMGLLTSFRFPRPDLSGADYRPRQLLESFPEDTRKVVGWGMTLGIPIAGFVSGAVLAHFLGVP